MTDDMNQSKRKPWTNDPDVVKQIWGENGSPCESEGQPLAYRQGA